MGNSILSKESSWIILKSYIPVFIATILTKAKAYGKKPRISIAIEAEKERGWYSIVG